ncbi:Noranthrone monooxygenase [Cytospora mali]|uniref:Noranthrone monooxygenase n=1 Tax=Cytospora mali TaxID=578113 RepID=A0A194VWA8_CYTMA|nr:Noranthrone monooxygenase [Valsa mali]
MATSGAQATALVTGSFLSGAMMSLSLIAVPVFLDTTKHAPQLFHQWARMYNYGHQALPTMAVGTCFLYLYTASKRSGAKGHRALAMLAGLTTVIMLPFTWFVMMPTNDELFKLEALSRTEPEVMGLAGARELVVRWAQMHFVRCLFPLAGAILGAIGTF